MNPSSADALINASDTSRLDVVGGNKKQMNF